MKQKALIFLSVTFLLLLESAPGGTIVSSGTGTLRGTWCFSFDLGSEVNCSTSDVWWEQINDVNRQMVPMNGTIVNIGVLAFNPITLQDLTSLSYGTTPINGNNDPTNLLVNGDIFAVHTSGGNYAKVLVLNYGYDLYIQWVTESPVPNPVLVFLGTEPYQPGAQPLTRYLLSVSNWQLYPAELFVLTSAYGPCGLNPNPSRTWVDIYDQDSNYINGFCGLPSPWWLTQIWFAEPLDTPPPAAVYVVLTDRQSNTTYTSNLLPIEGANPIGYSPIAEPLNPNGGTNIYPFAENFFNYKVIYPALNPPTIGVDLVVQPILISQDDLNALVGGTPFWGATIVPYDETGGFGVLFRATCQDSSGNPVTCPETTGPYDAKTSWNPEATISDPAFLMAPVGTQTWENIFTAYSVERIDGTASGRTCCHYSDFVFVTNVTGPTPEITISTPQDGAIYLLNEAVQASYSCTVVSCYGDVPNGSNIDTSSVGSKTFTVNANSNAGPAGVETVQYQVVVPKNVCLLYDPNRSVKKGATFPIKLEVCDAAGNNLSSPSIVVQAVNVTKIGSNASSDVVEDSGNANPDYGFRFDSTLGVGGAYIYNLSTKGLSTGTWKLNFKITGDPSTHSVQFGVK